MVVKGRTREEALGLVIDAVETKAVCKQKVVTRKWMIVVVIPMHLIASLLPKF